MLEPFCPSTPPLRSFDSQSTMIVASNGTIVFEASPNSMGGMGFEIKYECPAATTTTTTTTKTTITTTTKEPCEDIKSTKWCKKQKKNGKCSTASVWTKCKSTCDKCD
jgi:hypothetical protein